MSYQYRVITVFGGSGFLGRHLIQRLARTGAIIRVAVRHPSKAVFLKTSGNVGQIVPLAVDLNADESVAAAVRDADVVINLTGILFERGRQTFAAVHEQGAARIARLAAAAGARHLVHVSALGADRESTSAYARSKARGEELVREAFPAATILRPSLIFGPEDRFFNRFAGLSQILWVLPLIGCGRTRFQPVYVGDVVSAVMESLRQEKAAGKTFLLGGPEICTFAQLLEKMLQHTHRSLPLVPVPWKVAEIMGRILQMVPLIDPLLTRDQVELLKSDTVVRPGLPNLSDLGIAATAMDLILPTYLTRFCAGGRFAVIRERSPV